MTLYDVLYSCLFILDKNDILKQLNLCKVCYQRYMEAVKENRVDNTIITNKDGSTTELSDSIENLKNVYENEIIRLEYDKIVPNLKFLTNKVFKLISTNYLPCRFIEEFNVSLSELPFNAFTKKITSVKNIVNLHTSNTVCDFYLTNNALIIKNGLYKIEYCYSINDYEYFENICDFLPCLTSYAVVDGVLGEYYMLNGFYDEANFYLTRFESQMSNINKKVKEVRVKERVWA